MSYNIKLETATLDDADSINILINQAYRGAQGWTRETGIVAGERTSLNDVKKLIKNPGSHMLVAKMNGGLAACICIEEKDHQAYIGTFSVDPLLQNKGLGKAVLKRAEQFATNQLGLKTLKMVVISQRGELIDYYLRRGYKRTGEILAYPVHLNVGKPVVEGLTIEYLEKKVN